MNIVYVLSQGAESKCNLSFDFAQDDSFFVKYTLVITV
jgi:hypothetical protein